jgi:hypothetical protein
MLISRHVKSHIVELEDGSRWRGLVILLRPCDGCQLPNSRPWPSTTSFTPTFLLINLTLHE